MNYSYWEYKEWFTGNDFVIIGSGIVGLNCAINLRERFPTSKIIILEKGLLPQGASTKNAGFACFGSTSELLSDLKTHSEQEVFQLVKKKTSLGSVPVALVSCFWKSAVFLRLMCLAKSVKVTR